MQVKTVVIEYTDSEPIHKVYGIGCLHAGTIHHPVDKVTEFFNSISSQPRTYALDLGDSGEFITPQDPRFEQGQIADYIDKKNIAYSEAMFVCGYYVRLESEQRLGKVRGNHEDEYGKHSNTDIQGIICSQLHIPDLGSSAFVRFVFKRKHSTESHLVTGFFAHGAGGGITKPSKMSMILRVMDDFNADFYAIAHGHDIITVRNTRLGVDSKGRVKSISTVGAMCGCAFRTYTQGDEPSYGEKKLYPPTVMGNVCFEIDARTGLVTPKEILY